MDVGAALRGALEAELGAADAGLRRAVERLTAAYRSGGLPGEQLGDDQAARAYAAYRMPATFAAVRAALAAGPRDAASLVDVGGGTGAAVWAAADVLPGLASATVLDRSAPALAMGRRLAAALPLPVTWTRAAIGAELPPADLVTLSYVLGELPDPATVVAAAARAGRTVAVVEPGTPAGHQRVLRARDQLIAAGLRIAAPCPHAATCPWATGPDWCHFAARLPRSPTHRQVKGGTLGWEDEKYSYVVATRAPGSPAGARIVRHPQIRKGLVELTLCADDGITREVVSKRHGPRYRAARDASWGDPWLRE